MPKKTTQIIFESGNDYLIQVKGNQRKLYQCIQNQFQGKYGLLDQAVFEEVSRGYKTKRIIEVAKKPKEVLPGWEALNRVIRINKTVTRGDQVFDQTRYFISSLKENKAKVFAQGIRGHWSIENQLHWVKDVIQNEDRSRIARNHGVENLSVFKNIAINFTRQHRGNSVKHAAIYYAANIKELWKKLRT